MSIGCILANDFSLSAFARFVDFIRFATDDRRPGASCEVTWCVMSHHGDEVRASCEVRIAANSRLVDPSSFDYILVIGGISPGRSQLDEATAAYVVSAAASGVKLVGLCTGSFILARLGLMRDRTCCVHRSQHQDFVDEFPDAGVICDRHFLVDRDRITCGGGAGTAHLASYLIGRHIGRATDAADIVLLEGIYL